MIDIVIHLKLVSFVIKEQLKVKRIATLLSELTLKTFNLVVSSSPFVKMPTDIVVTCKKLLYEKRKPA